MVGDGARVAVFAFGIGQVDEFAPGFTEAVVFGALIAIVAEVDVIAFDLKRLVNIFIAIIVQAVAGFLGRSGGIARRQAIFGADPLAAATPKFVG